MGKHVVSASAHSAAPPEAVWRLLSDSSTWTDWGIWQEQTLEREGDPAPYGVGAIRTLTSGRNTMREEITEFDAPRRVGYTLHSGIPTVRNYEALVTLTPEGEGTRIEWRSEFDSIIGGLIRRRLQGIFEDIVARLASAAAG